MIAQINTKTRECRLFDIRKLSPRECGRLMDVPEWALDRLLPAVSNSAAYKLFGNSIVVSCLKHIYRQIWFYRKEQEQQLRLFDDEEWPEMAYDGHGLRVVTICSGYDAQCLALDALREEHPELSYDLMAWSEFDPESKKPLAEQPAVVGHNAIYPQWADRNMGDMTTADWQSLHQTDIDLLTYSTPCTDISQAGKRKGIAPDSGTRSAILWHTEEAIRQLSPRFLIQENVAALVNEQNRPWFDQWRQVLTRLGYDSAWTVMNARQFGVPQNRERVFCVSWRRDLFPYRAVFPFPKPMPLTRCIADVLEPDASPALYLKPESVTSFLQKNEPKQREQRPESGLLGDAESQRLVGEANEDGQQQYIYATVSHRPTSTQIDAIIAEQATE
jgi:DNA (cytosine-5)-methyltransferase 1